VVDDGLTSIEVPEVLRDPEVGLRLVRGGTLRVGGYGLGMLLTAVASILLLHYLSVADFGRLMTVTSLMAVVAGLTEGGLNTIASRDLAVAKPADRHELLANLLGLRLILAVIGVALAVAFAVAVGYEHTLVVGTALAGLGVVLASWQSAMTVPLSVELRIGWLTSLDAFKQAVGLVCIALLVWIGAPLLPFFATPAIVAAAAVIATPIALRGEIVWPRFRARAWLRLGIDTLPLAATVILNVLYFRLLILLMSLLTVAVQTGLFATSARVLELLFGISSLAISVVLPVFAAAAANRERLAYMLQRVTEMSVITAMYLVVLVFVTAGRALSLIGGAGYGGAAHVLRIQVFALLPVFVGSGLQLVLVAIHRQRAQAVANAVALVVLLIAGLALIPSFGANGAAVAAIIAETSLAVFLFVAVARAESALRPSLVFAWKPVTAGTLALALVLTLGLSAVLGAVIATVVYLATLLVTRAIPPEVIDSVTRWR
jgi:O-antigen/teichoic acid export membrane protein